MCVPDHVLSNRLTEQFSIYIGSLSTDICVWWTDGGLGSGGIGRCYAACFSSFFCGPVHQTDSFGLLYAGGLLSPACLNHNLIFIWCLWFVLQCVERWRVASPRRNCVLPASCTRLNYLLTYITYFTYWLTDSSAFYSHHVIWQTRARYYYYWLIVEMSCDCLLSFWLLLLPCICDASSSLEIFPLYLFISITHIACS